jgi:GntR family transcriptional regulator/MocR family aminotransferase
MRRPGASQTEEARWLTLDPRSGETLRAALERTLRDAIRDGALRPGVRLPSSRVLALQLGVSRGVTSDAYAQLEAQGFLETRPRAAPIVAAVATPRMVERAERPPAREPRYDLTPTTPDVALFPLRLWLGSVQQAARQARALALGYGGTRGERVLHEALADHLGRTRGVVADPGRMLIVQGTAQAIDLVLRVLAARGARRIAVEDPSHQREHEQVRALGLELVPRALDGYGIVVGDLAADAALVTPAHQFPTGVVLGGERRRELLAWARSGDRVVIEDDYDAEFRYDRDPVRALQGLDPELVAYVGSVSKTLAPALRLGWLVVPAALADEAERTKRLLDDFSPVLDQLGLARMLARGDLDRHVRRVRAIYRRRRDALRAALADQLPELATGGVAAGMHLLLWLPAGCDDRAIAAAAQRAGVRVPALAAFRVQPSDASGLVLGYGRLHEDAAGQAVALLAGVVRSYLPA